MFSHTSLGWSASCSDRPTDFELFGLPPPFSESLPPSSQPLKAATFVQKDTHTHTLLHQIELSAVAASSHAKFSSFSGRG